MFFQNQTNGVGVSSFEKNYVDVLMRAWKGSLEFAQLIDCANQMESRQLGALSAVLYQTWLGRNTSPYAYAAYFNMGVTLSNLNDFAEIGRTHV